jgi:heme A synthase
MNIIGRVKKILFTPKAEWQVIAGQQEDPGKVLKGYVIPLVLAGGLAAFIGYGFIGETILENKMDGIGYGIGNAINRVIVGIITLYVNAFVINELAPSFNSTKDFSKSFQLVAYGATPLFIALLFSIIPAIENITRAIGLVYSVYLWWLALPYLKNTPPDRAMLYLLIIFAGLVVAYAVLGALYAAIMFPLFGV